MTPEAALTKLSYLLGRTDYSIDKRKMVKFYLYLWMHVTALVQFCGGIVLYVFCTTVSTIAVLNKLLYTVVHNVQQV